MGFSPGDLTPSQIREPSELVTAPLRFSEFYLAGFLALLLFVALSLYAWKLHWPESSLAIRKGWMQLGLGLFWLLLSCGAIFWLLSLSQSRSPSLGLMAPVILLLLFAALLTGGGVALVVWRRLSVGEEAEDAEPLVRKARALCAGCAWTCAFSALFLLYAWISGVLPRYEHGLAAFGILNGLVLLHAVAQLRNLKPKRRR